VVGGSAGALGSNTIRKALLSSIRWASFLSNYVDSGVLFISARNIKVNGWSLDDAKYITEKDYNEFSKRVIPEIGDVLYTKGGDGNS
jgi:type I restriction enzyme S subunit